MINSTHDQSIDNEISPNHHRVRSSGFAYNRRLGFPEQAPALIHRSPAHSQFVHLAGRPKDGLPKHTLIFQVGALFIIVSDVSRVTTPHVYDLGQ